MTQVKQRDENSGFWANYGVILAAVLVLVGFMLPPVKRWLNAIPNLWTVLYPLLSLFAIYILIRAFRDHESLVTILKWCLLLISATAMTVGVFTLGAVFYTIGRSAAYVFIVVEFGTLIYDAVR